MSLRCHEVSEGRSRPERNPLIAPVVAGGVDFVHGSIVMDTWLPLVRFANPGRVPVTFTPRVLSGAF